MDFSSTLTKIGSLAGLITFCWTFFWTVAEWFRSFLLMKVEVRKVDDDFTIYTQVQNPNKLWAKKIKNAFIIISPEQGELTDVIKKIASHFNIDNKLDTYFILDHLHLHINSPNEKKNLYLESEIAFLPIRFYYDENISIADEQLTYTCFVSKEELKRGVYSVRFYVSGKRRYLRFTQDLMIIS